MQSVQLSIPKPCHENWDKMTPTQQGRFCNACAKQVVDFTTMSDGEVLNFFLKNKTENVCGRTLPQQLDRVLEAPKPITPTKLWYWKYAAAGLLFFSKADGLQAQSVTPYTPKEMNTVNKALQGKVGEIAVTTTKVISGKITDKDGYEIPFASVRIKGTPYGVSGDADGRYSIKVKNDENVLQISATGYELNELNLRNSNSYDVALQKNKNTLKGEVFFVKASCTRKRISCTGTTFVSKISESIRTDSIAVPKYKLMDEVVVATYGIVKRRVIMGAVASVTTGEILQTVKTTVTKTDTLKQKILNLFSPIKIYPNPAQKGQTINISFSNKYNSYAIQVVSVSGVVVLNQRRQNGFKEAGAFSKKITEQIIINPQWSSGHYLINILNEQGKVIAAASFLVL